MLGTFFRRVRLTSYADSQRLPQAKAEPSLRRQRDFLLARGRCPRRTGPGADCTANQSARATPGETSDERAARSAAADEAEVALIVVPALQAVGAALHVVSLAVHLDGVDRHGQTSRHVKPTRLLGIHHSSGDLGALRNNNVAVDDDRLRSACRKDIPDVAVVTRERLVNRHADGRPFGNDELFSALE